MTKLGNQPSSPIMKGGAYVHRQSNIARVVLSGAPNSAPIDVPTSSVLVHEASDYAYDEIFLWASNYGGTNNVVLHIEIGGDGTFADASKIFKLTMPKEAGLVQIYPGVPHQGVSIYAKAASASHINLFGYADRHYPLNPAEPTLGYNGQI